MMRLWWWLWASNAPWWRQSLQKLLSVTVFMAVASGLLIVFDYVVHGYVRW